MISVSVSLASMWTLCCIVLLAILTPSAYACNGYKLLVKKVQSKCMDGKPSIFELKGFNISMDANCIVRPHGCAKLTEGFKTAEVTYVLKSPLGMTLMRDTKDGCDAMKKASGNPQLVMMLDMFNLPSSCENVTPKEVCGDGKEVDFKAVKDKLRVGSLKGEVTVKHENNKFSCVVFELSVKK